MMEKRECLAANGAGTVRDVRATDEAIPHELHRLGCIAPRVGLTGAGMRVNERRAQCRTHASSRKHLVTK